MKKIELITREQVEVVAMSFAELIIALKENMDDEVIKGFKKIVKKGNPVEAMVSTLEVVFEEIVRKFTDKKIITYIGKRANKQLLHKNAQKEIIEENKKK